MKKILALFVLILLFGCGAPEVAEEKNEVPVEPSVSEPAAAPAEPVPVREDVVIERQQVLDDGTKEAVVRAEEKRIVEAIANPQPLPQRTRTTIVGQMLDTYNKIDSYQFKTSEGVYYVRGDKVRFLPRNALNLRNFMQGDQKYYEIFVDEIVFDRTDKTATGYCFGFDEKVRRDCEMLELFDKAFKLQYNETFKKMPDDWLKEYEKIAVGDEQEERYFLNSIETTRVAFKDGVQMYFFPLAGLPIKIVKGPLESIVFENLVINRVNPEDVIHRARDQISPNEVFYQLRY
jgi:hypothetical protein